MNFAMRPLAAVVGVLGVLLAGCASQEQTPTSAAAGETTGGGTQYPLTVDNCGEEVVFESPPERVLLLESAPVTVLDGLGVLDTVVARAGAFPAGYYDPDLEQRIDDIESFSEDVDASGHLQITPEAVIAHDPDLALGLPDGLTREGLSDAGTNTLVQPVFCPAGVGDASFEQLYDQILEYGQIFDRNEEAARLAASMQERVSAAEEETAGATERTAAVLYPSIGGGPVYSYGRGSMAQPQLEAAGFTNVFDDASERVFEVSIEELIGRDPDVLILLYSDEEQGILEEITSLPGSDALRAVDNGDVLLQLFNFTEPPSPLSVDGLEQIVEHFGTGS